MKQKFDTARKKWNERIYSLKELRLDSLQHCIKYLIGFQKTQLFNHSSAIL